MNRNSIVIPRKRNYDYIKVTESILKDFNESDRKSGNKRNSYRADLQSKSHNISKSQLPKLTALKKTHIQDENKRMASESPNKDKHNLKKNEN